jgi:hypothetical protein
MNISREDEENSFGKANNDSVVSKVNLMQRQLVSP